MSVGQVPSIRPGETLALRDLPTFDLATFRRNLCDGVRQDQRVLALFGQAKTDPFSSFVSAAARRLVAARGAADLAQCDRLLSRRRV